jgi:thiamine biosynthesis lipoprotein
MRKPGSPADGGLEIGPNELGSVRRFSHEAMATVFEVLAEHPDAQYAAQAAHAAFDLADRLERELSRFIPNSDIGRIHHLAVGGHTRVSQTTMECLVIARHMFELTGGAFDVSIGTGLPSLDLDPEAGQVLATASGVRIDLGGIGKGYAVDLMADLLEDWGLERALVHGGFSSVLALDAPTGCEGWPLTLTDPASPSRRLGRLSARRMALGASGLRKGDHIIDPRTGEPARGRRAAWVVVPVPESGRTGGPPAPGSPRPAAAAVADALTTAFMLLSEDEITRLCAESPGLETWILADPADGQQGPGRVSHLGGSQHPPRIADAGSSDPA